MNCPKCGTEVAADAKSCGMCGLVFEAPGPAAQGQAGPQIPAAPSAPVGQQVGQVILPEGISPKAPAAPRPVDAPEAPGPSVPGPSAQAAPVIPAAPEPAPRRTGRAALDMEAMEPEVFEAPKPDIKMFVLLGIVLLGVGGFLTVRSFKKEVEPPPAAQPAPAPVVVKPPPDPLVESCKAGIVGQGFLSVEAEAYCEDSPEAWARAEEVQKARAATIPTVRADEVMDVMVVPVKGETTPKGLVRVYVYLVMSDPQNRACAAASGALDVSMEPQPVGGLKGKPLAPERFRREALPGRNRPTVHAFLGTAEFDPAAVGGAGVMVTVRFDNGRLEHQAAVSF